MGNNIQKLNKEFFNRPVDVVAKDLVGKILVRENDGKEISRMRIITTEAYGGGVNSSMPDSASHSHEGHGGANKGDGQELEGGNLYIAYSRSNQQGAHRQINITTGEKGDAQAVLIKECQLLYKDNLPNKEDKDKGILSEAKIGEKVGLNNVEVGGHNMKEYGISVFSDGELIESSERRNVNNRKQWRFSIKRLLSVCLILLLLLSLASCSGNINSVYAGICKNSNSLSEWGDRHVEESEGALAIYSRMESVDEIGMLSSMYLEIKESMKFTELPEFDEITDVLQEDAYYYDKFYINGYEISIESDVSNDSGVWFEAYYHKKS